MKKIIALALCVGFVFALTGCKKTKTTPDEIEQQISQKLADSKYVDAHISGDISFNIPNAGNQKITINTDYKSDISSGFPKMLLNGTFGLEGVMSFPVSYYMDESKIVVNLLGNNQETPIPEEGKAQIRAALGENGVKSNLNKTVNETKYNEQNALEITYDVSTLNQYINNYGTSTQQSSINSLVAYYLLTDTNDLDSMVVKISLVSQGSPMDINLTVKFNSIGEPVEITPITSSTPATEGVPNNLNLLTIPKSAA